MALSPAPAGGGMPPADPMAGAGGAPSAAPMADDSPDVVVTICKTADGSYMVYSGDEPDDDAGDMSGDDAGAMGAAGGAPASTGGGSGQPADSIGQALKLALDLLQADKSSEGAPGNSDDQLAAGFAADKNPTPASGPAQKY